MSKDWEKEYTSKSLNNTPEPALLLKKHSHLLTGGQALDIASGAGQNSIFLSSSGYNVTAVDKSSAAKSLTDQSATENGVQVNTVEKDILSYDIADESFDLIADFYFLERKIIHNIKKGLKKNGLLFFETYTIDQQKINGPHNPDFLLEPNELISFFTDFFIIFYHERTDGKKSIASLIAQKTRY